MWTPILRTWVALLGISGDAVEAPAPEFLLSRAVASRADLARLDFADSTCWRFRKLTWYDEHADTPAASIRDGVEQLTLRADGLLRLEVRTRLESDERFQPRVERYGVFYDFTTGESVFRSRRAGEEWDGVYLRYWSQLPPQFAWSHGWIGFRGSLPAGAQWTTRVDGELCILEGASEAERYTAVFERRSSDPRLLEFERRAQTGRCARIHWRYAQDDDVVLVAFESLGDSGRRKEAAVWVRIEPVELAGLEPDGVGPDAHVLDLRQPAPNVVSIEMDRRLDWSEVRAMPTDVHEHSREAASIVGDQAHGPTRGAARTGREEADAWGPRGALLGVLVGTLLGVVAFAGWRRRRRAAARAVASIVVMLACAASQAHAQNEAALEELLDAVGLHRSESPSSACANPGGRANHEQRYSFAGLFDVRAPAARLSDGRELRWSPFVRRFTAVDDSNSCSCRADECSTLPKTREFSRAVAAARPNRWVVSSPAPVRLGETQHSPVPGLVGGRVRLVRGAATVDDGAEAITEVTESCALHGAVPLPFDLRSQSAHELQLWIDPHGPMWWERVTYDVMFDSGRLLSVPLVLAEESAPFTIVRKDPDGAAADGTRESWSVRGEGVVVRVASAPACAQVLLTEDAGSTHVTLAETTSAEMRHDCTPVELELQVPGDPERWLRRIRVVHRGLARESKERAALHSLFAPDELVWVLRGPKPDQWRLCMPGRLPFGAELLLARGAVLFAEFRAPAAPDSASSAPRVLWECAELTVRGRVDPAAGARMGEWAEAWYGF